MSRTNPERSGGEPDREPPIDRTQAYQPERTPAPAPDLPVIPGITLNFEIARGGMGIVYSGRQDFLDRRVAVKLLSRDLAGEKFAARFRREAKILAGIKHAHIVACHSAGTTDDGQSYLVMEFVDGPNLKAWIAEHGAVPVAAALRLTKSLGQALSHAHQLDVIHRDVKPENILLETITSTAIDVAFPFVPKLVDLGLARMTSEAVGFGLTSPGAVMGTPTTMSPEQFDDPDSVDYRTDIYGLGCVLYEMLVGMAAFRGTKMTEIVTKKKAPIGPNPCAENPAVPTEVGELVRSMLASEREQRPPTYRDLDERLDALIASLPAHVPPAKTVPPRGTKPPAPTAPPPSKGAPSGPGLLRTAELDFLQEGLGAGPARTAFREGGAGTGTGASAPPTSTPPIVPTTPGTAASLPAAATPRAKRGVLVAAIAGVVIAAGGGVWFATRGSGEGDKPIVPPAKNSPPTGEIAGPSTATFNSEVLLEVKATDSDNDPLTYHWTLPDGVQSKGEVKNSNRVVVMNGLPGEPFVVQCAVGDSKTRAVELTKTIKLEASGFPTKQVLRDHGEPDSKWVDDPPEGPRKSWNWISDRPGYMSCRTLGALRTTTLPLEDDPFWKVEGRLRSRKDKVDDSNPDERPVFGEPIVRIEVGEKGWSLHCRREGDDGEKWSIELRRAASVGGEWRAELIPGKRIEWQQAEDAKEDAFADLVITRRRDTLSFRFGRFEEDKAGDFEVTLPAGAAPKLACSVDGGAGEFRAFTLW